MRTGYQYIYVTESVPRQDIIEYSYELLGDIWLPRLLVVGSAGKDRKSGL